MQDYKLVVRGLVGGASILDPVTKMVVYQNFSEFMSYLNEQYLSQGYKILSSEKVRVIEADSTTSTPVVYEFAYHLIKEYNKSNPEATKSDTEK